MLVDRADPASEAHSTAPDDLATLATSWRRTRWGARSAHQGEPDEEHAWSLTQASAPDRGSAPDTSTGSAKRPGRSSSAATRPSSVWPTRSSVTPSGAATRSLRSCGRTRQPGELPAGCASTPRPAPEVPSMAESTIAPSSRTLGQRPSLSALPPVLRGGRRGERERVHERNDRDCDHGDHGDDCSEDEQPYPSAWRTRLLPVLRHRALLRALRVGADQPVGHG